MIKEAMEHISALNAIDVKEIAGRQYVRAGQRVERLKQPDQHPIDPLQFATLTGLVDFIANGTDAIDRYKVALHVFDYNRVDLIGPIDPDNDNTRFCYARAECQKNAFRFGQWMAIEDFIINLQTNFDNTLGGDVEGIIDLVGHIASEHIQTHEDKGFAQTIQVKTGLTTKSKVTVQNPVTVYPWRTFTEIKQPATLAVLRFAEKNGQPHVALFESAGDLWRLEAIKSIKDWLKKNEQLSTVSIFA